MIQRKYENCGEKENVGFCDLETRFFLNPSHEFVTISTGNDENT